MDAAAAEGGRLQVPGTVEVWSYLLLPRRSMKPPSPMPLKFSDIKIEEDPTAGWQWPLKGCDANWSPARWRKGPREQGPSLQQTKYYILKLGTSKKF